MPELRKLRKYTNYATWYTGENLGDRYRNNWKRWVKRKFNRIRKTFKGSKCINKKEKTGNDKDLRRTTTVMFVPSTEGNKLLTLLEEADKKTNEHSDWKTKFIEKPGVPLQKKFLRKFPLIEGCAMGTKCIVCEGDGVKCSTKNVVYTAECLRCKEEMLAKGTWKENMFNQGQGVYVGESSRQLGVRTLEHMNKFWNYKQDFFILQHYL